MDALCMEFSLRCLAEEVEGKRVLELGAMDVNGSVRSVLMPLKPAEYVGVDMEKGPGVDVVCRGEELVKKFGKNSFDTVVCVGTLEHVEYWRETISNMKGVCKPGGAIVLTTCSPGFIFHGYPHDYWRFTLKDLEKIFSDFKIERLEEETTVREVMIKARKPARFIEKSLSGIKPYRVRKSDKSRKRILEVGCGGGLKSPEMWLRGDVTGIDISEEALEMARNYFPHATYLNMKAEKLSFPDSSFDEVHLSHSLEHVEDEDRTLDEASRVLKAGAKLFVEVPHHASENFFSLINPGYFKQTGHRRVFTEKIIVRKLNAHGFEVRRATYHRFIMNVYLAGLFLSGNKIANQQGAPVKEGGETKADRICRFIMLISNVPVELVRGSLGKEGVKEMEEAFGMPLQDIALFLAAADAVGTRLFPEAMRLECVNVGGKAEQKAEDIKWESLPPVPKKLFSGSGIRAELALKNYDCVATQLVQANAKLAHVIAKYGEQERHYSKESAELRRQLERARRHSPTHHVRKAYSWLAPRIALRTRARKCYSWLNGRRAR